MARGKRPQLPLSEEPSLTVHRSSVYIGETATIEVGAGEHKQTFYVRRDLLSYYSGYFKAALHGNFAEAGSGIVKLDTEEPSVFEGFVKWLYTRRARSDEINADTGRDHFMSVVKLWIFADRRDIPLLMNEMIDRLQQCIVTLWCVPGGTLREVYDNTTAGCALRRMIVDIYKSTSGETLAKAMTEDPS